jgi:two-component system, chemotaxis family, protein-glutamate methylesterase/glutaminase
MFGHDLIVLGSSAGGIKALSTILSKLSSDIQAAIFIVQHLSPNSPKVLPRILEDVSSLSASHPKDGEKFQVGKIYIAEPDYHLLIERERVRVVRGPQENRFRPAIDALFRSAARTYGPRVLGVLLTGNLDDGTVGLQAIKKRGGVTIVQDPKESDYPSMPLNAMKYVSIDHCLPLSEIAPLLLRLVGEPSGKEEEYEMPAEMDFESKIAEQELNTKQFLEKVEEIGTRTSYTCPECNGSIWQIGDEDPLRFRCHVGHSFTAGPFLTEQTAFIEKTLWSAVKALEEKVTLTRQIAQRLNAENQTRNADEYEKFADKVDKEVGLLRQLILHGSATKRTVTFDDPDQE